MPENREEQNRAKKSDAVQESQGATEADASAQEVELDLEGLDLTVETVEERISPSETNVFDK